jgi:hypothetical protein
MGQMRYVENETFTAIRCKSMEGPPKRAFFRPPLASPWKIKLKVQVRYCAEGEIRPSEGYVGFAELLASRFLLGQSGS